MATDSVATARGPVAVGRLGTTLTHEHLFVVDAEYAENYLSDADVDAIIDSAARRMALARAAGVESIVDLTVHGIGRMMGWIRRLADRTDINLLLSTGVYVTNDLPRLYSMRGPGTLLGGPDPMTDRFIADLTVGIGSSGIRAAALKLVTDKPGITPGVLRALNAVSAAQRATGVPLFTHSDPATRGGLEQQRLLAESGVDLTRVVIGHCGDTADLGYLETLLTAGSYVGLDRFGELEPLTLHQRCGVLVDLVRAGWIERILLSHDSALFHAWMDDAVMQRVAPDSSFTYLFDRVLPELRRRGLTEADLHQLLVVNPAGQWAAPAAPDAADAPAGQAR